MSIRWAGFARRSFIIGSRLCPPAMTRASEPSRCSDAIAPSTLVARSYSNDAGVCTCCSFRSGAAGEPLARGSDVVALLVLDRGIGADHGRPRQALRAGLADLGVQQPRGQAASFDVAQHRALRARGGDGGLA